jgi:hypothetical protein
LPVREQLIEPSNTVVWLSLLIDLLVRVADSVGPSNKREAILLLHDGLGAECGDVRTEVVIS